MSDPFREHLGMYLDGELSAEAHQAVAAHLEACPECQAELAGLRRLSQTLRQAPLPTELPSAAHFTDQLMDQLPARPAPAPFRMSRAAYLIPLGLLAAMAAVQAGILLSSLIPLAAGSGLLGEVGAWLEGGAQHTLWFSAASAVLGGALPGGLDLVNSLAVNLQRWLIPLLLQLAFGAAYLAWLAVWWSKYLAAQPETQTLALQA